MPRVNASIFVSHYRDSRFNLKRQPRRNNMIRSRLFALAIVGAVAGVAGCATQGEVDQLRSEVSGLRSDVNALQAQMQGVRDSVDRAAAADAERQDRMFQRGLRK
jgi:outer membrane murein-binding lipoprotein Lpp